MAHVKQKDRQSLLDDFMANLRGTVNWERILREIRALESSQDELSRLGAAIIDYIQRNFQNGTFGNLEEIEPVLEYLGIDSMQFTSDWVERILAFYVKYSLSFLYEMTPTRYNGRLRDGSEYDRIKYVRKLLGEQNAPEAELTDEYITQLWDAREILVQLHRRHLDMPPALLAGNLKISHVIGLLTLPG